MNKFLFLSIITLLAASCSPVKLASDYDRSADFSTYKTFAFTDATLDLPVNEDYRELLILIVKRELQAKGFRESESNPDVLVNLQVKSQLKGNYRVSGGYGAYPGYGYGFGYPYAWGGTFSTSMINYDSYKDGTLFIDMVDAGRKQLVWQGRGSRTLEEKATEKEREANLTYAVKQILSQYTPAIQNKNR